MTNIRQSKEYALFIEKLGWKVEQITDNRKQLASFVYIRKFPLIGSFIKILRIKPPIPFKKIEELAKKYRAFKIQIESDMLISNKTNWSNLSHNYRLSKSPLAPTKTILIDLESKEEDIFDSFSPEKRRAIRRAIKNEVIVKESDNINEFVNLKNKQLWPFGFLLSNEIKALWKIFSQNGKATLLLAFTPPECEGNKPIAGVLLLFHDNVSYYWLASSTPEGKTLFAPSLLVWEALKLSKKKGCTIFDFEGVEDERFPETKNWAGFTKFKNGFGGKEVVYAHPLQKLFWPIL